MKTKKEEYRYLRKMFSDVKSQSGNKKLIDFDRFCKDKVRQNPEQFSQLHKYYFS